jgi:hypothetical protein
VQGGEHLELVGHEPTPRLGPAATQLLALGACPAYLRP